MHSPIKSAIILMLGLFASTGIIVADITQVLKKRKIPGMHTPITMEILNKNPKSIWVMVSNGGVILKKGGDRFIEVSGKKDKAKASQFAIDITKPTEIAIWEHVPKTTSDKLFGYVKLFKSKDYLEEPYHVYGVRKGKTIFVTWDKDKYLRPQTGPQRGWWGKTESNLSFYDALGNYHNVSDLDLQQKSISFLDNKP